VPQRQERGGEWEGKGLPQRPQRLPSTREEEKGLRRGRPERQCDGRAFLAEGDYGVDAGGVASGELGGEKCETPRLSGRRVSIDRELASPEWNVAPSG